METDRRVLDSQQEQNIDDVELVPITQLPEVRTPNGNLSGPGHVVSVSWITLSLIYMSKGLLWVTVAAWGYAGLIKGWQ
jgi:hypothetical protein